MKQILTTGIILSRTDFGEADRILTVLTPDRGKLRLMARGVRRVKSKLAGGIELFSTSHLTYIEGRGEIGTLVSTRLIRHYGGIIRDIDRVQLGYELIKQLNRATEDQPEPAYYALLEQTFGLLDDPAQEARLIRLLFEARLLRLAGHAPNLTTDSTGQKLAAGQSYNFDFDAMAFTPRPAGKFTADHIKALRLFFSDHSLREVAKVQGITDLLDVLAPLVRTMLQSFVRV
ncbi:MAG TPA: DNA repair protein RecO [Candidatus Saccharimonadales bacterium]|nr:DNA repair protein RecO [Candidatus Saccharimonadales bacterium]